MITGHGDDIYEYEGVIRHNFSSNLCTAIQMEGLKEYLSASMDVIDHYPPAAATALERELSILLRNRQGETLITSGATEAIYLIAQATGAGCRSSVLVPTFSEYADACRLHGHQVTYLHSLDEVTDEMNVVWLCNPNNPTGQVLAKEQLVRAAFDHPHTVFIIDQSYAFFCREELLQSREAAHLGNVILLHSMTKKYGIPGLRLGYVTGPQSLIDTLRDHRMPWSVNALALVACRYLLEHHGDFHFDRDAYLQEAQRLRDQLNRIRHIEALPTQTHFMLVRMAEADSLEMKRRLVDSYGILVRSAHNFAGLDRHYIRVAAQTPEENDLLVKALDALLNPQTTCHDE